MAFGVPEVAELMAEIFGNNPAGTNVLAWSVYWRELNIYEESLRDSPIYIPISYLLVILSLYLDFLTCITSSLYLGINILSV
jgi:hypothetical protein